MKRPFGVTLIAVALIGISVGLLSDWLFDSIRGLAWGVQNDPGLLVQSRRAALLVGGVLLFSVPGVVGISLWKLEGAARLPAVFCLLFFGFPLLLFVGGSLFESDTSGVLEILFSATACLGASIYLFLPSVRSAFGPDVTSLNIK